MDSSTGSRPRLRWIIYGLIIVVTAGVSFGVAALLMNITQRKHEAAERFLLMAEINENVTDPEVWGRSFPHQYDGYLRTVDNERTRHGGSEAMPSKLDKDPLLRRLYAGYGFSLDYREKRGHAFMLQDQEQTERVTKIKQPGACLHCHSSVTALYRSVGNGDVMKGFETVCAMPYQQAHDYVDSKGDRLIKHPVACVDCHDPATMQLKITRPGFLNGIRVLAESDADLPHLPSIQQWRSKRKETSEPYNPNVHATRQEMRSFVCGQCHVEYYFKGPGKLLTYPWQKGLKAEQIEQYYDEVKYTDWTHAETKASILKAQHPEFELWNQGIHARSGVACADCHMPYKREGAVKISDHQVRSPMLAVNRACQVCHRFDEAEIRARVEAIQSRTRGLAERGELAMASLMDAMAAAQKRGVSEESLREARALHRKAQWRLDFILSENSNGFHAPQEAARILGEAIDFARQGQVAAILAK